MKRLLFSLCLLLALVPPFGFSQTPHQGLRELQLAPYPQVYTASIVSQGTTATPSQITIRCKDLLGSDLGITGNAVRVRVCNSGTYANSTNATIAAGTGSTVVDTASATKDLVIRNVAAVAASGTLTIGGVATDAETVTANGRVYELDWDATATITAGRVRVDISGGGAKSQGTLAMPTQPTAGDTMTIGTRTYVYVPVGTADAPGEISVGASLPAAKVATVAAINGTDGFNTANSQVSAATFAVNDCVLTAHVPGTAPNSYPTTETFTAGGNVFDAAALGTTTAGTAPTATQTGDALVAAWAADTAGSVTGVNANGTVTVSSKSTGTGGNAVTTTETMANGAFGSGVLSGGVTGDLSAFKVALTDASAETVTVRIGPAWLGCGFGDYTATLNVTHAAP